MLSYFRQLENDKRADRHDGSLAFTPEDGLLVTRQSDGAVFRLPGSLDSKIQTSGIPVYCLSTVFDEVLASRYGADSCVEIFRPREFIRRFKRAVTRSHSGWRLFNNRVTYYEVTEEPGADWALPETLVFRKLADGYEIEREYRLAFGPRDVFEPYNVTTTLVRGDQPKQAEQHSKEILDLGDLSAIARIHSFRAAGTTQGSRPPRRPGDTFSALKSG